MTPRIKISESFQSLCYLQTVFIIYCTAFVTHPNMTDQQPSTSADRMRKLREKRKKDDPNFSANESKRICELRKRKRESLSEMELKTLRVKERDKKRLQRAKIRNQGQSIDEPSVSTKSPYKSKQTLSKAVQKALKALPQSPSKKER